MSGFEPWIPGVGSNRSANCATTTANGPCKFAHGQTGNPSNHLNGNPELLEIHSLDYGETLLEASPGFFVP